MWRFDRDNNGVAISLPAVAANIDQLAELALGDLAAFVAGLEVSAGPA